MKRILSGDLSLYGCVWLHHMLSVAQQSQAQISVASLSLHVERLKGQTPHGGRSTPQIHPRFLTLKRPGETAGTQHMSASCEVRATWAIVDTRTSNAHLRRGGEEAADTAERGHEGFINIWVGWCWNANRDRSGCSAVRRGRQREQEMEMEETLKMQEDWWSIKLFSIRLSAVHAPLHSGSWLSIQRQGWIKDTTERLRSFSIVCTTKASHLCLQTVVCSSGEGSQHDLQLPVTCTISPFI